MSTRICLVALIGLPAAGKSRFSRWILSIPQQQFNVIHLCYDDFLPAQDDTLNAEIELKLQRSKILANINSLICELNDNAYIARDIIKSVKLSEKCNDFLILCDDNNYYRSMRYKLYQLCRQNKCAYAQIYLECDLKLALSRNSARPDNERVSEEILQRMEIRLERPNSAKHHWEENTLFLEGCDNFAIMKAGILDFLSKSLDKIVQPLTQSVTTTETVVSLLHQLDLLLRKRIGEILRLENDTAERSKRSKMLIAKRKAILQEVRKKVEKESISIDDLDIYVYFLN
ncbi:L-seryl-tRNA(Sec) kinase [Bactrocera neohumeralis]|uniref:L-seryl-tRNA(Sec) kinase n=1 Tax=Bactrocera tryoni TaxID=59916 RepID=UPI001A95752B|nr:L-seryl-tRNA(Sec) kinase [Bactrocera tryoni]XP_050317782.1 L-seryl-tRNA(Sec) kinase [Bactrocera neohumeralis]